MTTTPLQQLFLLNSEFVDSQSVKLAARLHADRPDSTTSEKIVACYQYLFQRNPSEVEIQLGERFLALPDTAQESDGRRWPLYIQSLLGLNELLFVD